MRFRREAARVATVTGAAGGFRHLDVTAEKQWSDVVSAVVGQYGRVDVLVAPC